jgi:ribonucleoside-diphosphate reductase alpha subunit
LRKFTHATPTLFNAGFACSQMSSCFLLQIKSDSVDGIYDTIKQCAQISKHAGGIGLAIHNVRAAGSPIIGTNGKSNGIVPMLRVFDSTARYIDQCFTPETLVYTTQGLKPISRLVIGDEVFGQNGTPERVSQIFRSHNTMSTWYSVRLGYYLTNISPEHPVCALRNGNRTFIPAKDLKADTDRLVVPVLRYEQDVKDYTLEDCRFYGSLLASYAEGMVVSNLYPFYSQYLVERGCVPTRHPDKFLIGIDERVPGTFKFHEKMLYHEIGRNKSVHPYMMNLPIEKAMQIVRGIWETTRDYEENETHLTLFLRNKEILDFMLYTFFRAGVRTETKYPNCKIAVVFEKTELVCNALEVPYVSGLKEEKEFIDLPISEITLNTGGAFPCVYDLKTEGPTHTYLTQMGLVHNGGGKRKGSFAIYLEPWHADIEDFLRMKLNTTKEEMAAQDLFYAVWMNDLFMRRMMADEEWTLFSPDSAPGLSSVWGEEFERLYLKYENEGRGVKKIKATDLWKMMYTAQIETGVPYMQFKDAANRTSNQQHLGTIQSSNLCTEIIQYTSPDEVAVCNLASICLPAFMNPVTFEMDYEALAQAARVVTRNLNKIIDLNYYPVPEARNSNQRHRPIGVGVQGLADVFLAQGLPFDSPKARDVNKKIFEVIYYGCLDASCELAEKFGTYSTYKGSPFSKGILQMDMWPNTQCELDWTSLRQRIQKYGTRNSLLTAPMPTASTSQICGNNECIEAYTSNVFTRKTIAGSFVVVNKWLIRDLEKLGLWNAETKNHIISNRGSVQNIAYIPDHLKKIHRTAFEISQRSVVEMARDRAPFIDQSQSLNIYLQDPTFAKFTALHTTIWKLGLIGSYYFTREMKFNPAQFSVQNTKKATVTEEEEGCLVCSA